MSCTPAAELGGPGVLGASGQQDAIVVDGVTSQPATALRLEGQGLLAQFPVVSLAPLGLPGSAFGAVIARVDQVTVTLLDANDRELERHSFDL